MPRIRTIKPEFWSSPSMGGLDPWTRLLFVAMWNWADDTGRGTANPKELAGFAFPHEEDPITAKELPSMLTEIRGRFDVVFYEVSGRRYFQIPTFDTHQRTERKAASRFPGPEVGDEYDPIAVDQGSNGSSVNLRRTVTEVPPLATEDAQTSGTGTGEQGNRVKDICSPASPTSDEDDPDWLTFWEIYPRKVSKKAARARWRKALKHTDAATIIAGARRYAEQVRREGRPKDKIKQPDGWLNDDRWADEDDAKISLIDPNRITAAEVWG
jgi:hypothetical protein